MVRDGGLVDLVLGLLSEHVVSHVDLAFKMVDTGQMNNGRTLGSLAQTIRLVTSVFWNVPA